eukprot:gene15365-21449_t
MLQTTLQSSVSPLSRESSHYFASSSQGPVVPARSTVRNNAVYDRRAHEKGSGLAGPRHRQSRGQRSSVASLALFDPPPFRTEKLTVLYTPGISKTELSAGRRRYTLTHNDVTGDLSLTVGDDYNHKQISGFYTRLLRDEVTAEWIGAADAARTDSLQVQEASQLHIYCHVNGEEKWLAPPLLRNYIFRREIPLVLDTFLYADRELLASQPDLKKTEVVVHFQSDIERFLYTILGRPAELRPPPELDNSDPLNPLGSTCAVDLRRGPGPAPTISTSLSQGVATGTGSGNGFASSESIGNGNGNGNGAFSTGREGVAVVAACEVVTGVEMNGRECDSPEEVGNSHADATHGTEAEMTTNDRMGGTTAAAVKTGPRS